MKWFKGTIKEAVNAAKQNNCYFAVYIEGDDKLSETMTSAIYSEDISSILESEKFISIRIQYDSEEYHNFVNIYKHVPVPSLFLIGTNGLPIAVINNLSDEDKQKLRQNVLKAISTENKLFNTNTSCESMVVSSNASCSDKNITLVRDIDSEDDKNESQSFYLKTVEKDNSSENISATTGNDSESADFSSRLLESADIDAKQLDTNDELTPEDNERRRPMEDAEEQEDTVRKTALIINRAEVIRMQRYEEEKRLIHEKQQERIRNDLDRQRILKDIALDKEERLACQQYLSRVHQNNLNEQESGLRKEATQTRPHSRDETLIQFRKPNGSTVTKVFNVNNVINDLRIYVARNISLDSRQFDLAIAFPRHVFTVEENNKTLEELELVPNAVILILPITNNSTAVSNVYSSISNKFWYCVSPAVNFFRYIRQRLYNAVPTSLLGSSQPTRPASSQLGGHYARNSNRSRRASTPVSNDLPNVHTMTHANDDDDEYNE